MIGRSFATAPFSIANELADGETPHRFGTQRQEHKGTGGPAGKEREQWPQAMSCARIRAG